METQEKEKMYTKSDLVTFGKYLLSREREKLIHSHPEFISKREEDRFRQVHDADLSNWENSDASL